ncbi:MAG: GAF domain-containing protein [Anaerolineae bacterium]|nr:GAF domain-containing protein [Anaerolineae bacterium]
MSVDSPSVITPEANMNLERLKSLYELIGRMNSVYDLQQLLEFIVDRALSLTGARSGVLLLNNDKKNDPLDVAVVRGKKIEKPDLERILKFVSTTVIQDVLSRTEPRLVIDLPSDQRYEGLTSSDTVEFKGIRSVLAVPFKAGDSLVGLLYIDHPKKGVFGQSDLDFISAFANQAALGINRAREHQHQIERLTLLNELSRSVVQALDLDEVLTRIVSEVTRMLDVEASSVLLLEEVTGKLTFATSVSNGERLNISTRLKKDEGVAGWVMTHGEPCCINDVSRDPRWFGEVETGFETHSLLCVPLQIDNHVVGVLQALNKHNPSGFDPSDVTLLTAFAASATIAIENAQLFQEASQARQLRALNEVAISLSSTFDLNKIIDEGLKQSLQVLKAEAGVISIFNYHAQNTIFAAQLGREMGYDQSDSEQQMQALSQLTSWLLTQSLTEFLAEDVLLIDNYHPQQDHLMLETSKAGIRSLAVAPVKINGSVNGAVAVMSTSPHIYSVEEVSLLSSIARIVGMAAQNAIHYTRMQAQTRHLTYLNEIGSALTRSLNLDHVFEVIIEGVNTLLQTELTSVFLIDPETNELVLRYSTRNDTEIRLSPPWQGIAGWVATHDQPALVNNTQSDPRHLRQIAIETGYAANSILCVPLKVEGQMIGVVEVLNKTDGQQFSHLHQSLLIQLTKWAAIALHNARLFDERVRAYQDLDAEQQRRIAAETRGAVAAIILDMAHTMNNVVGAIRVWATTLEYASSRTPHESIIKFDKAIRQIRQNAEEAIKLMSTMTGPLQQATLTAVDVEGCLDAAVQSCWWPENVDLVRNYASDIPLVRANAERLEAVFHNLLSNAIQALADRGGQIQILTLLTEQGRVQIKVTDDGPGIAADLQGQIFNPGVSGKDGGLGIGLWLVETFVHQFDGQIECSSAADKGTTFTVTLQPDA